MLAPLPAAFLLFLGDVADDLDRFDFIGRCEAGPAEADEAGAGVPAAAASCGGGSGALLLMPAAAAGARGEDADPASAAGTTLSLGGDLGGDAGIGASTTDAVGLVAMGLRYLLFSRRRKT